MAALSPAGLALRQVNTCVLSTLFDQGLILRFAERQHLP